MIKIEIGKCYISIRHREAFEVMSEYYSPEDCNLLYRMKIISKSTADAYLSFERHSVYHKELVLLTKAHRVLYT